MEGTLVTNRKPEFVAWIVIWISFAFFCLSALGVYLGARWFIATANNPAEATVKIISGTVLVKEVGTPGWRSALEEIPLREGDSIRTDSTSQAMITLFDKSTIIIFPESELSLSQLRVSRFDPKTNYINILQSKGRTRIGVAPAFKASTKFSLVTQQTKVNLSEGSYSIDTDGKQSEIRVRDSGEAEITSNVKPVSLRQHQRTQISSEGVPGEILPAARDLIVNGNFETDLQNWQPGNALGVPEGHDIEGKVVIEKEDGFNSAHLVRRGSKGSHSETYLYQYINRDVSDFSTLRLSLEMKLVYQSLSGGGYMGSEYPILVRIKYNTSMGETVRVFGFYSHNEANNRTDNAVHVEADKWITYTVPENLMTAIPQPRRILSVEITASGHDYESLVKKISLAGE